MGPKKRVVIVEDHTILRQGLKSILSQTQEFEVVGEAQDGLEAIRCVEKKEPDVMLLDLNMPRMDGISVIKDIKKRFPATKIVVLTMHKKDEYILQTFKSGADAYCLKEDSQEELLTAIRSVMKNKSYVSPGISGAVLEGYLDGQKTIKEKTSWDTLTRREREVLKMVAEGYQNKEISDYLCISVKTVEKHRANIMQKLDLHSASALTAYAYDQGLIIQ